MRIPNSEVLPKLQAILSLDGVRPAIVFLNSLTTHRFTSLYRFDCGMLRNHYFYDRENPVVDSSPDIPITASYCIFLYETGEKFTLENSDKDYRVSDHPKRKQIKSYCGVPLFDRNGNMYGSICHFNLEPTPLSDDDVYLLEAMAGLLQEHTEINA